MTAIQRPLSNIQMELLKLYSRNIDEADLLHFKNYLAQFSCKKLLMKLIKYGTKRGILMI